MKFKQDWKNEIYTKTCCQCGYVYATQYDKENHYNKKIEGDEDFIELYGCENKLDYGNYEKRMLYACPVCGCVQIRISVYDTGE